MAPTFLLRKRPSRWHPRVRLQLESLESRWLPSGDGLSGLLTPVPEVEPNDTLDQAVMFPDLASTGRAAALGSIADPETGVPDVDWYGFSLGRAARVSLIARDAAGDGAFGGVLGLYNSAPFDFADPYNPTGNRLLAQAEGTGLGGIERVLSPGTYFVALSGSGNRYFHPYLANSGSAGDGGTYKLLVTATDLPIQADAGPVIVAATPGPGEVLERSPFTLRLSVSASLDPNTILPGSNVRLTFSPDETFGDANDQDIALGSYNFTPTANELQLTPGAPLRPGYYHLLLAGDGGDGQQVLADTNGTPLGKDADHPLGNDFVLTFQVDGVEGNSEPGAAANDTPAGAHELGDVTTAGLLQVGGAIGDDAAYDFMNPDPLLANPGADVDLYHFQVSGAGRYALVSEVFAGRIGSPLDSGLSLFRLDPDSGQLDLVGVTDNTLNDSVASNQTIPLFSDPVLYAGLTAGDYYLAVSAAFNLPDIGQGLLPGTNGVFDPSVSHSGTNGFSTGAYVLGLRLSPDSEPPRVESVAVMSGATGDGPPTRISIQFSEAVNLQQQAFHQQLLTNLAELPSVFVRGADGVDRYPRLLSYDQATNRADFLMLDGLPAGTSEIHLSGALGLGDLAGNPLTGNDPAGDYVVSFTVTGAARGTDGDPQLWSSQQPNDSLYQPQELGVLYPRELQGGVTIERIVTDTSTDTADYYRFEVLQGRPYLFLIPTSSGLPPDTFVSITNAAGDPIFTTDGPVRLATLAPGVYVVGIGGWEADLAGDVTYELRITLADSSENPTPLTTGPTPAYRIRLTQSSGETGTTREPVGPVATGGTGGTVETGGTGNSGGSTGSTAGNTGGGTNAPPPAVTRLELPTTPARQEAGGVVPADFSSSTGSAATQSGLLPNTLSLLSAAPIGGVRDANPSNAPQRVDRLNLSQTEGLVPKGRVQPAATAPGHSQRADTFNEPGVSDREPPAAQEKLRLPILDQLFGTPGILDRLRRLSAEVSEFLPDPNSLFHERLARLLWGSDALPDSDHAGEAATAGREASPDIFEVSTDLTGTAKDTEGAPTDLSRSLLAWVLGLGLTAAVVWLDRRRQAARRPALTGIGEESASQRPSGGA